MKLTEDRADAIQKTVSRLGAIILFAVFEAFVVLFIAHVIWGYIKTWVW